MTGHGSTAPAAEPAGQAVPGGQPSGPGVRLGLRANLAQFALLVAVNALVGGTLGQERTVVPLLAEKTFHLAAFTSALSFILAFGAVKAATNFFAGTLSDRYGRKPVLVAGWVAALPIPVLLIWAPSWGWVVAANVLLGINQGLTWSTTVIMKIDLVGPARRGLAMGLNEAAGYGAVALTALATGYLAAAYGLRPAPFLLGAAYIAVGLGLSAVAVRETRGHARHEAATHTAAAAHLAGHLSTGQVAVLTSFREKALSAACQAGLVNNLNDGLAWGLFPILFARHGLTVTQIGVLAALYPAVWGAGQLGTGALSDKIGRKWLIAAGMGVQAAALGLVALGTTFPAWAAAAVLLGAGTAMVYPTLLAAIGDVAHPAWRARSVGVYRLWRDGGFAVGALLAGATADAFGILTAIWIVAALTAASGLIVAVRMYETRSPAPPSSGTIARTTIDELLASARSGLKRLSPAEARRAMRSGATLIDIRGDSQIARDGTIAGALVIARNVLEWRLDPASAHRHPAAPQLSDHVILLCDEGYQSSLAAATLQQIGFTRATDVDGGFQAWRAAAFPVDRP